MECVLSDVFVLFLEIVVVRESCDFGDVRWGDLLLMLVFVLNVFYVEESVSECGWVFFVVVMKFFV